MSEEHLTYRRALDSSNVPEWRKDEIRAKLDQELYSEKPSIFELIKHIKDIAEKGFSSFEEAGFDTHSGFLGKTISERENTPLCVARECLRGIYYTIQDERFNELPENRNS